jgi:hypothetical protein
MSHHSAIGIVWLVTSGGAAVSVGGLICFLAWADRPGAQERSPTSDEHPHGQD